MCSIRLPGGSGSCPTAGARHARGRRADRQGGAVTDAALLWSVGGTPGAEGSSVQAMFEILDTRVLVISASVGALRRWSILYQAFRARPGPADITVVVGSCGDAEQPRSGEAAVIVGDVVVPWTGAEPLFPPLWAPPLDRWVYLRGTAVGRAGQA